MALAEVPEPIFPNPPKILSPLQLVIGESIEGDSVQLSGTVSNV